MSGFEAAEHEGASLKSFAIQKSSEKNDSSWTPISAGKRKLSRRAKKS
jgi:hypothetical protein